MDLQEYRRKRRFTETPEPPGAGPGGAAGRPRFVVQEHHARSVHWDLRLEMEGTLRSWAVPKGPSLDPADKRLAVLVEDHPLEYGEFEGVIPPGNYGAGTVMVWDRGTYECREGDPAEAFRRGKLTLVFFGSKLRGEFHFVRTKRNNGRDWLLFKGKDEFAVTGYAPSGALSVKSGRPIEEIRAEQDARWTPAGTLGAAPRQKPVRRRSADPFPAPFRPMLAQAADRPFDRPGWLFEVKWDGVRILAFARRRGALQEVVLYSRSLRRLNAQFPEIVEALSGLAPDSLVLDGEIVAPDERGQPSFARLQRRLHRETAESAPAHAHPGTARPGYARPGHAVGPGPGPGPDAGQIQVAYAVFDCLYLEGRDLRSRPFAERRRQLEALALPAGVIRGDVVPDEGLALFEAVREHGLEGIVAKKAVSPYRPGVRSPDWQKIKVRRTLEAVVGGITRGQGHRAGSFGAVVLGQYDPKTGALVHIGQTGGGFKDADLRLLRKRLEPLFTKTSPFAVRPRTLTPATWVKPEVVVEVEYGERTPDGLLRFPVFVRVRDDLAAREVRLPPPEAGARAAPQRRRASPVPSGVPAAGTRAVAKARAVKDAARPPGRPVSAPPTRRRGREKPLPAGLAFTNLDKVFFPGLGHTKRDVIEHYRRMAPYLVPHLADRPLTLRRFPDGIDGNDFFQKDVTDAPPFVRTEAIWSDQGDRDIRVVIGADEATLLWLAQLGCIEMHAWLSRVTPMRGRGPARPATSFAGSEAAIEGSVLNYPDFVIFDIDPFVFPEGVQPTKRHGEYDPDYTRRGFEAARQAALWLGEALDAVGLRSFLKTSGKTGLHAFVPIARRYTYAQTHAFAKTTADWLVRQHPDALTTAWAVRERVGKVFLDYNQNVRGKTLASVYSLRPVPDATVSVPVTWDELRAGFDPLVWTISTVADRLRRVGDLWAGILAAAQRLEITRS